MGRTLASAPIHVRERHPLKQGLKQNLCLLAVLS